MKNKIKQITNKLFNPFRKIWRTWVWSFRYEKAKLEANKKNAQDGRRYFVVWDPMLKRLISLTYDKYKGRTDSYKYLRIRGRFKRPMSREQFKDACYYFTGSKGGARAMSKRRQKWNVIRLRDELQ